jgi:hypothetical protein
LPITRKDSIFNNILFIYIWKQEGAGPGLEADPGLGQGLGQGQEKGPEADQEKGQEKGQEKDPGVDQEKGPEPEAEGAEEEAEHPPQSQRELMKVVLGTHSMLIYVRHTVMLFFMNHMKGCRIVILSILKGLL